MSLFLLLLIPVVICGVTFLIFRSQITLKEFCLSEAICSVIIFSCFKLASCGAMQDTEILGGRVVQKNHGSQNCCHCILICTSCGKDCTTCHCQYLHAVDYYWSVSLSTGDDITVDSCESNKSNVPRRWTEAYVGEPAFTSRFYANYLLADPQSILRKTAQPQFLKQVPEERPGIYDLYRTRKVVSLGVKVPDSWESRLQELNADLGASKQIDVTFIFTKEKDPRFADAIETKWIYGPKNGLYIVAGVPDGKVITWTRVITISEVELLKVSLRDKLVNISLDNSAQALIIVRSIIGNYWKRTSLEKFKYLATSAEPKGGWLIAMFILALLLSIGVTAWAHKVDIFGEEALADYYSRHFKRRSL